MVNEAGERQRGRDRPIVAFDFDGTITVKDSFMAFLAWRAGPIRFALGMLRLAPHALAYLTHRDRGRIKQAAVRVFLRGMTGGEIDAAAESFAASHYERLIRPDAEARFRAWTAQKACVLIVTASPDAVVAPFANRLEATAVLGTRLLFDEQGRITGAFVGDNCRGEEKVRRIKDFFGREVRLDAAYGDTSGDIEMLAIADAPGMRVFHGKPANP